MNPYQEGLLDKVEIVEPPMLELRKRGPWFTTACLSGCGGVVIFVLAIIIGIKIFVGAGHVAIKALPDNLPKDVPIYDQYNINKITFIQGRYRNRGLALSNFIPRLMFSSLIFTDQNLTAPKSDDLLNNFKQFVLRDDLTNQDYILLEWYNMQGAPENIYQYYHTKLQQAKFQIEAEITGVNYRQFTYNRADKIGGTVYIEVGENPLLTPYSFITINLPPTTSTTPDSAQNIIQ